MYNPKPTLQEVSQAMVPHYEKRIADNTNDEIITLLRANLHYHKSVVERRPKYQRYEEYTDYEQDI